jgi:two-component system, NarL family, nitrate/nitrite response regulator NarL
VESRDAPLRCLIVDDSECFRDAACRLLERDGLAIVGVASTIAEGMRSARELKPDVTLVDVHLGAESGFELARRLRQERPSASAAVILTSADPEQEFAERHAGIPADGFVPKSALSGNRIRELAGLGGGQRSAVGEERDRC